MAQAKCLGRWPASSKLSKGSDLLLLPPPSPPLINGLFTVLRTPQAAPPQWSGGLGTGSPSAWNLFSQIFPQLTPSLPTGLCSDVTSFKKPSQTILAPALQSLPEGKLRKNRDFAHSMFPQHRKYGPVPRGHPQMFVKE